MQSNKEGIPKDLNELKSIKCREHAKTFVNQYMNKSKKTNKSQYCKTHHISHNSLNTGLKQLGHKTRVNETKRDQTGPIETNPDQPVQPTHKPAQRRKRKPPLRDLPSRQNTSEIKAGQIVDHIP